MRGPQPRMLDETPAEPGAFEEFRRAFECMTGERIPARRPRPAREAIER